MIAREICRTIGCVTIVVLMNGFLVRTAVAQTVPSPAPSAPAPSAPAAAPVAGAAGGMPIEATILAYQGLQSDANSIASAIASTLPSNSRSNIIIATPGDVAAILQLRIVLHQIATLHERLHEVSVALYSMKCRPTRPEVVSALKNAGPLTPLLGLFSTPSDISTMLTTIASLYATTEAVSAQSGAFQDATLMTLVAENLNNQQDRPVSVFVPGVAPPNFGSGMNGNIAESDRNESYIYDGLRSLETQRNQLQRDAKAILDLKKCKSDPDAANVIKLVAGAAAAVDSFESGMLGGPLTIPPTGLLKAPPDKTPDNGKQSGKPSAISATININPPPSPPAPAPPSSPTPLQQLLYVDLLLHQLGYSEPSNLVLKDVYLLAVHALESGGTQLTKTALFLGARVYFSGGAASTFTLVKYNGSMLCSGIAYGYRGFVKADDVALAVQPVVGTNSPSVVPGTQNALPNGQRYVPTCASK